MPDTMREQLDATIEQVNDRLESVLPKADTTPSRLHDAMRYAVLNGGKRIRPSLVYATGECLDIDRALLDPVAVSIELIHAFSLVHDDLPAMDDDDLRRGRPTVHKAYDEATAILAADALQPLAFQVLATADALSDTQKAAVIAIVARASGSRGMTGGQSIDLEAEGKVLAVEELREMHTLKTGALLGACVMAVAALKDELAPTSRSDLAHFATDIGLAFQIRDDILDVVGETEVIGKPAGSDEGNGKATWPALLGLDASREKCADLLDSALDNLAGFGVKAEKLRELAKYIVQRAL